MTFESIFYITQQAVTLSDIAQVGENLNIDTIYLPSKDSDLPATVNLKFGFSEGEVPVSKWCRWEQRLLSEIENVDESSRQKLLDLKPESIFWLETRAAAFPDLLPVLKILLEDYGGWVDCHGDFATLLDLQTIDQLPKIFPFGPRTEAQVLEENFAKLSYMWTTEKNIWVLHYNSSDYLPYNTDS